MLLNPLRKRKRKRDKEGLFFEKPFIIEMKHIMLNDDQVEAEIEPYNINACSLKSQIILDTFNV